MNRRTKQIFQILYIIVFVLYAIIVQYFNDNEPRWYDYQLRSTLLWFWYAGLIPFVTIIIYHIYKFLQNILRKPIKEGQYRKFSDFVKLYPAFATVYYIVIMFASGLGCELKIVSLPFFFLLSLSTIFLWIKLRRNGAPLNPLYLIIAILYAGFTAYMIPRMLFCGFAG